MKKQKEEEEKRLRGEERINIYFRVTTPSFSKILDQD